MCKPDFPEFVTGGIWTKQLCRPTPLTILRRTESGRCWARFAFPVWWSQIGLTHRFQQPPNQR